MVNDVEFADLIRRRAYAIWESEGKPEGRHDEHWQRAHKEMHGLEDAPASADDKPVYIAPAKSRPAARESQA